MTSCIFVMSLSVISLRFHSLEVTSSILLTKNLPSCVARATLWFCPFFSYDADVGLFLETGKGLTCAVFTESVDLRPD